MSLLSHVRFQWVVYSAEFLIGAALIFLFWRLESRGIRVFLLLVGTWLIACNLLRLIAQFNIQIPHLICKQLASSIGITLAALFVLLHTQKVVLLVAAWLLLLFGVLSGFRTLMRLTGHLFLFSRLVELYHQGLPAKLARRGEPVALIYVLAEQGLGVLHADRLCGRLVHSLMRHRKQRMAIFLTSGTLRNYSEDFRRWLAAQSAALIIVRFPKGIADKNFERLVPEYCVLSLGSIFQVTLRPKRYQASEASQDLYQTALLANISSFTLDSVTQHKTIASLTDQMAMSTFPIADADSRLSDELGGVVPLIAKQGLVPIANSYLRFRLSQSDVERFLSLLDCIEASIKCSVIALLTTHWQASNSENASAISAKLNRPSLGHWTEILRALIACQPQSNFQKQIADFWSQPLIEAPIKLIDEAKGSGLSWNGPIPGSYLHWLAWFIWLRNVTRGHGVVKEELVANLWHGFHEVFLHMVFGLEALTLVTKLRLDPAIDDDTSIVGWGRSTSGSYYGNDSLGETGRGSTIFLHQGAELTPLFPFMISNSRSVLLWNSVRKKSVEYIDCRSGQLNVVTLSDTDPYTLWKQNAELDDP
jgi:hypothetical protein